jgi:two-component system cell cycle response regulator DivK
VSKGLVLYVEDNFENRLLMRRVLLAEDFDFIEAENAAQALEILQNTRPDIILMDINMPDVDGYTLIGQIRALPGLEDIPILAVTANVMRGDRERSLKAGANGYIQKPINIDTIASEIENYLPRSK